MQTSKTLITVAGCLFALCAKAQVPFEPDDQMGKGITVTNILFDGEVYDSDGTSSIIYPHPQQTTAKRKEPRSWHARGFMTFGDYSSTFSSSHYAFPVFYTSYTGFTGKVIPKHKGFDLGFNLLQFSNWHRNRKWFVSTAIGLSYTFMFSSDGNLILHRDSEGAIVHQPFTQGQTPSGYLGSDTSPFQYSKPRLQGIAMRLPVNLTRKLGYSGSYKLSAGLELEYHAYSSVVNTQKGYTFTFGSNSDIAILPFGCNAIVSISSRHTFFFARTMISDLFDNSQTEFDARPFGFGWGFSF